MPTTTTTTTKIQRVLLPGHVDSGLNFAATSLSRGKRKLDSSRGGPAANAATFLPSSEAWLCSVRLEADNMPTRITPPWATVMRSGSASGWEGGTTRQTTSEDGLALAGE